MEIHGWRQAGNVYSGRGSDGVCSVCISAHIHLFFTVFPEWFKLLKKTRGKEGLCHSRVGVSMVYRCSHLIVKQILNLESVTSLAMVMEMEFFFHKMLRREVISLMNLHLRSGYLY